MSFVLLSSDLAVLAHVEGAAARRGQSVRAASKDWPGEQNAGEFPTLVLLDLSMPSLDLEAVVRRIRSIAGSATKVVAFGPHVHEARLAAARAAGCDQVVTRGQFMTQLDAILAGGTSTETT